MVDESNEGNFAVETESHEQKKKISKSIPQWNTSDVVRQNAAYTVAR
jgi:hypothetical protein